MTTLSETMTPRQRVAAGVRWLDKCGPSNWREKINTDTLDMSNGRRCILGQVFADHAGDGGNGYIWVCDRRHHGINYNSAADYGFVYTKDGDEWLRVLAETQPEAPKTAPKTLDSLMQEYAARIEKVYAEGTNGDYTALGILSQFVSEYKSL